MAGGGKAKVGRGKATDASSKPQTQSSRAGLQFPVGRLARYMRQGRYSERTAAGAPVYMAAVLE
jgi:histone H2A